MTQNKKFRVVLGIVQTKIDNKLVDVYELFHPDGSISDMKSILVDGTWANNFYSKVA